MKKQDTHDVPKDKVLLGIFDSGVGGFTVYKKIKKMKGI